jgi:Transposase DDE domain group 1
MGRFPACFGDGRTPVLVEHSVATRVAQRVFGIALGYEDLVDHDQLRHEPVLATLAGKLMAKRTGCAPLAGKSTLNRLEHAPAGAARYYKIGHDGAAIARLVVDVFLEAHQAPPRRIVLDLDATDDPLHGHQQGRFLHGHYDGYYDGHGYRPRYLFCGSQLSPPSSGARTSLRQPARSRGGAEHHSDSECVRVEILLRAASGFARAALMSWCEANRVDYVFGRARNERLVGAIADSRARAEAASLAQGGPARHFAAFAWQPLDRWRRARRVVAQAEPCPRERIHAWS